MSPVGRTSGRIVALAYVLSPTLARAETSFVSRPTLEHYVGYSHKLTRGVTHLGLGIGMGGAADLWRLRVHARSFLYAGATDRASGPGSLYHSRAASVSSQVALGYPLRVSGLAFVPGLFIGGTALFGSTTVIIPESSYARRDVDTRYDFQFGPEIVLSWTFRRTSVGVLGQGAFVHTHVAGPIFSGYLTLGFAL
jgi:hypothetical protein